MSHRCLRRPRVVAVASIVLAPCLVLAGFSVDETPRETNVDPGDIFFTGLVCDMNDGDFASCLLFPSLKLPSPTTFDMDALAIELPVEVCPDPLAWPNGILFSIDDADPGPGGGAPDNPTEIFFYDHCSWFGTRMSYYTSLTESALGLGTDPPPTTADDDVDAYDSRAAGSYFVTGGNIMFSPDEPSTGGLVPTHLPPVFPPEAYIWVVNNGPSGPGVLYKPTDLGVDDPEDCDIDGIAVIDEGGQEVILYTTDAEHPCGLDPGDIFASDRAGGRWLFADDVNDLKIGDDQDIDALSVNTGGDFQTGDPYEPEQPDRTGFKGDWPNYAPSGMPDFSQDHDHQLWPQATPLPRSTWCGPTAVASSLWWFDSEMECEADLTYGDGTETESNDTCDLADRLGERPPIPAGFGSDPDPDWYVFEIPHKPDFVCTVTVSTCARRKSGDADTFLSLYSGCNTATGAGQGLQAANDDGCLPDKQSEIVVDLPTGKQYWVEVTRSPIGPTIGTDYTISLGIDCYPMVQRYPGDVTTLPLIPSTPDDHSEYNPVRLIPDLADCMDTDGQRTGSSHRGTRVPDMRDCVTSWLVLKDLDEMYEAVNDVSAPPFYTPLDPDDDDVVTEVLRSEDVVLLLGFWFQDPQTDEWFRCGGHYVTVAGVNGNSGHETVSLSDPARNNAETGAPGRVRGTTHTDHAPALNPPPDHDDTENISHDLYPVGPRQIPGTIPVGSLWSIPTYGTNGVATTCLDVERWCMHDPDDPDRWRQNPPEPPYTQVSCDDPDSLVSAEVEWMIDVSPKQTPICIFLEPASSVPWNEKLRIRKTPCNDVTDGTPKDLIRGKLCNLKLLTIVPQVDLGHVQCLYDNSVQTEFDELSPDDTRCMGCWFYLYREEGLPDYGNAYPNGEPRVASSGDCP